MSHETFQAPELEQLAALLPAYDFHAFIAKGGMGAVYMATQRSLDREVAIKILPRELGVDPEFRKGFETEAKAMARLNHPNLIGVYDFGDVDGMPYIVMEYVSGKSLYHSAWNTTVDPAQAVAITKAICEGLGHAHENGIIHRDIKPANILLTPKAEPKIGDFGLALPSGAENGGEIMGTPGYAAPEYIQTGQANKRTDVYGIGVILHQLVTGQSPDPQGLEAPAPIPDARLQAIWQKAVHLDPNLRYADADAMAADLGAWATSPSTAPRKLLATPGAQARPTSSGTTRTLVTGGARPAAPGTDRPAAPARPAPPGTKAAPPKPVSTSSDWGLVRKLLIIAVLIIAIGFTYKLLKTTEGDRATTNEQIKAEQAEANRQKEEARRIAAEDARRAAEEKAAQARKGPSPKPEPKKAEKPLESLARLRSNLASGLRSEMPVGSIRRGENDYFLVTTPMDWHSAMTFAENHGGHLAIPHNQEDANWLAELVPDDQSVWTGAGRTGRNNWLMIDASPWMLPETPSGIGSFAALDSLGLIRARKAQETYPFFIQWQRDGANPVTLANLLRRTRETLDDPNPIFPPGTIALDGRHIVIITRPLTRTEAEQLAMQAGGALAVPASRDEAGWIFERTEDTVAPQGLWLGGQRDGDTWYWLTDEPWEFAQWIENSNQESGGTGLVLIPSQGWRDASLETPASGMIIEWSRDAEAAIGDPGAGIGDDIGPNALIPVALEKIAEATKIRDERLANNIKTLNFALDAWFRGLNSTDTATWKPHILGLKAMVKDNRIPPPETFGEGAEVNLSPKMGKACEFGYLKQQEADDAYIHSLTQLRDAYVARLTKARTQLLDQGQRAQAKKIQEYIDNAADLDSWPASLSPE